MKHLQTASKLNKTVISTAVSLFALLLALTASVIPASAAVGTETSGEMFVSSVKLVKGAVSTWADSSCVRSDGLLPCLYNQAEINDYNPGIYSNLNGGAGTTGFALFFIGSDGDGNEKGANHDDRRYVLKIDLGAEYEVSKLHFKDVVNKGSIYPNWYGGMYNASVKISASDNEAAAAQVGCTLSGSDTVSRTIGNDSSETKCWFNDVTAAFSSPAVGRYVWATFYLSGNYGGGLSEITATGARRYTLSYDANGGTGAPASQRFTYGKAFNISETVPAKQDSEFSGWSTSRDGSTGFISPGSSQTFTKDTTIYALWDVVAAPQITISNLVNKKLDNDGYYAICEKPVISWTAVPNASSYDVYYNGAFYANVTDPSCTLDVEPFNDYRADGRRGDSVYVIARSDRSTSARSNVLPFLFVPKPVDKNGSEVKKADVIINPCNGGSELGPTYNGRTEAADNLTLSLKFGSYLEQAGYTVAYTRITDAYDSVYTRAAMARSGEYRAFINPSRNAFQAEVAVGVEYYTLPHNSRSLSLSQALQTAINEDGVWTDRGQKDSVSFILLRNNDDIPTAMPYIGFIDNTNDNNRFDTYIEETAQSLARGTIRFLGQTVGYQGKVESPSEKTYASSAPSVSTTVSNGLGQSVRIKGWHLDTRGVSKLVYKVNGGGDNAISPAVRNDLASQTSYSVNHSNAGYDFQFVTEGKAEGTYTIDLYAETNWRSTSKYTNRYKFATVTVTVTGIKYTLKYLPNGGDGENIADSAHNASGGTITAEKYAKKGAVFKGWSLKRSSDGNVMYSADGSSNGASWYKENEQPEGYVIAVFQSGASVAALTAVNDDVIYCSAQWYVYTYTMMFISNEGTGSMDDAVIEFGQPYTFIEGQFVKTGYHIIGWNIHRDSDDKSLYWEGTAGTPGWYKDGEQPEGTVKTVYPVGTTVTDLSDIDNDIITCEAVWTENRYKLVYVANGGLGIINDTTMKYGTSGAISTDAFFNVGYSFKGWTLHRNSDDRYFCESEDGLEKGWYNKDDIPEDWQYRLYSPGQTVGTLTNINEDIIYLEAQWTPHSFIVSFNVNGGSDQPAPATFYYGSDSYLPDYKGTRYGYSFAGWEFGGSVYENGANVKNFTIEDGASYTFNAVWNRNLILGDVNGDGEIDASDANLVIRYDSGLIELTDEQLEAADVNGDGEVDSHDAAVLLKYDAGLIDSF